MHYMHGSICIIWYCEVDCLQRGGCGGGGGFEKAHSRRINANPAVKRCVPQSRYQFITTHTDVTRCFADSRLQKLEISQ
jgi:hypothetical protein